MKYDEGKLWAAVITRAIQDAAGKNLKLKKEACQWIRSRSFETVCELANFDFQRLKSMLNKFGINQEDSMNFSSKNVLKIKLIDNIKDCVSYLLPDGKSYQNKFYIGSINGNKIIVEIEGENVGNWYDLIEEKKGDIVDLWTLVKGDVDSAKAWLNTKGDEKSSTLEEKAFFVKHYLNDKSPMPQDIIGPRILTPGGLLVIGGTPKVGKSHFLLSLLAHLAAGLSFLGMKSTKPLKIFHLQNEMEYDYIRERIQQLITNQKLSNLATENLVVTKKMKLTLNEEGIEKIKSMIAEKFDLVDLIVIDSPYSSVSYGLQHGIEKLRSRINPMAGIIITNHTKKVSTSTLEKNPFQALVGANALRSFYTSGIVMFQPNKRTNILQVVYELRNGRSIPTKFINKVNGCWKNAKVIARA
ncbi:AAA family ATPase [Wolbachia endosymbiont of Diaphorina citri]|uniref:AAA family ATPase n=1 Tax=Wolbachia endosymbiont of Diaphorina citri TaxID=116598 RepID=UPI000369C560|nr:AAA family ATPase [Wolbachia endosymbiont of Diaphorina citri]QJT96653.1 AAA family ATPase [Wolbachia endosymbiont of Diaphorina citri]QLK11758.1 AAA family ATPase [Wolbachia endosymbiont of Diaphorina citri]QXY87518.1 AAA family ATPase [Wolbachia endosymbiont of Diaphorina citri]QXY88727.1 AAA family ATPase [Wolbachia endosymbiont of Diaphorina citri]QXY89938.1 AAA family ATPase [Wolbachia endosymbiont of Diaphorina citri]